MLRSPHLRSILCAAAMTLGLSAIRAADLPPGAIRFAVVSDTHSTRDKSEDHSLFRGRLERIIAAVNAAHPKFVLLSGDLTQGGKPEELSDIKEQVAAFKAPVLWVPGNHDVGNKKLPPKDAGPTAEQLARFEEAMGPSYYAKDVAGVHVIAVNSQLIGSGLPREEDEWKFLESELGKPVQQPAIVFMHVPPFLNAADEPGGAYWDLEPAPRERFLSLLQRGGIRTVIAGHLHRPILNQHAGILFAICPPASWGIPRGTTPVGWTLVTVQPNGDAQVEFKVLKDTPEEAALTDSLKNSKK